LAEYMTEQKKVLFDFLRENCEHAYSVEEIVYKLRETGKDLPKSTVYRLISRLVEDGKVKRMSRGNTRTFVYQIIAGELCHSHLHLKCMSCGKIIHMGEAISSEMLGAIKKSNNFSVSESETIILGQCESCVSK